MKDKILKIGFFELIFGNFSRFFKINFTHLFLINFESGLGFEVNVIYNIHSKNLDLIGWGLARVDF